MSIKSFIDYLQLEKKYSPNTIKAYENDIMSFSDYNKNEFDQSSISKVDYSQLRSWIVKLVESKISNRSINRKISSLNTYKFLLRNKTNKTNNLFRYWSVPHVILLIQAKNVFQDYCLTQFQLWIFLHQIV